MTETGYQPGTATASAGSAGVGGPDDGQSLTRLKQDYLSYLSGKSEEIKEQQLSRRYYHGAQWTAEQIRAFNRRKQPVVTYNRIARKLNAVVGLLEKQRQDPRGYPRTPKHEQGAEVATAVLRYVLDEQEWKAKSPVVGLSAGIDGLSGLEIILERGDKGDVEVGFETVDHGSFFYDPRSLKADFSDARFMGIGKWADVDTVIEQFPDKEDDIRSSMESGTDLTSNPDSDQKWLDTSNGRQRLRLVDHWYIQGGQWNWCLYCGSVKLASGVSPYKDEKQKTTCKYIMFSANVDQDGDRYGFVRNMKSPQDEINQRRSKGLHTANSRRIFIEDGNGMEVEKVRAEMVKPDGVVVHPHGTKPPVPDDGAKAAELQANLGFLEEAKQEIENYGFNPALMGTGVQDMSGRAIALQQQAGIAELGPYLLGFKGWKLRVYRAIWNAVQEHWSADRWVRVTDDSDVAQFFQVNAQGVDPNTGLPAIVNHLGSLDVDIILDEGPDAINMAADTNENVREALRSIGPMLSPQMASAAMEILIDTSSMPGSAKRKFKEAGKAQPPDPMQQQAAMLELDSKQAQNTEMKSKAALNFSKAQQAAPVQTDPNAQLAFDKWKTMFDGFVQLKIEEMKLGQNMDAAQLSAKIDAFLGVTGLAHDQVKQLRDHAHQKVMLALQPPPEPSQRQAA